MAVLQTFDIRWSRFPLMLLITQAALLVIGLLAIQRGDELVGDSGLVSRHLIWVMLSVPALILGGVLPIRFWREHSYLFFGISLALLVVPYFMPARGGSHRWIPLGPINFQPSEVAKLTYMMALAHYLMYRDNYRKLWGLVVPFIITLIPMGLILKEPDLGTSLLFLPVLFSMLFAAGARLSHLLMIIVLGVALMPVGWTAMSAEQKSRVTTLFSQQDGGVAPRGDGYHLHQSKQMLALGGVWGSHVSGPATDDSYLYHLPASRTDFIFCLVGERWGLWGCFGVIGLYLLMFAQGLKISTQTEEPFSRLLAVGIVTILCTQLIINTGMTVGLTPITGLTLPLLSYGGSSMLMTSFSLGLLLNIAIRPGFEVSGQTFRY
ncbi:FtsW/RodA/SpoVE family cell cycle protein [Rubinisphaera margarita]|uniref:FtsW/RodA/SpoVE family cell cycle protein n=1 Tax=Rubinisphaera margarita TaxID=2909586 RepID=UPI001EE8967E|nr:FtsW/RodA/SpoVE family cell cycle protein [Rubinisphaera margarita]MCG6155642.1 rod shape-determining protein RodA [Rubinisphaera margarita]